MLYLSRFTFPDDGEEFDFLLTIKRKCYDSFYPFKVLSARGVRELDLEPVTVHYRPECDGGDAQAAPGQSVQPLQFF